jgi:hypothetical protein
LLNPAYRSVHGTDADALQGFLALTRGAEALSTLGRTLLEPKTPAHHHPIFGDLTRYQNPRHQRQLSPAQLEERARLIALMKTHHPQATTEELISDLELWGE